LFMDATVNALIHTEIDDLVKTIGSLSRDAKRSTNVLGSERVEEFLSAISRGGNLIRRLYGAGSEYEKHLRRVTSSSSLLALNAYNMDNINIVGGVFKGVEHDIKSGLLANQRLLLQAEIFADFLEMAEYLLSESYKDAAAVLLGAVLEDSLRKLATARSISTTSTSGKPLTIDPINIALAKAGVYNALVQKQVTTWANLRNDAAHGHFDRYDSEQVHQMLLFVQKFCADYLQ